MGHVPSKIPQLSKIFKITSPLLATSHGGGALVAIVVRGVEVSWPNRRASLPTAYAFDISYCLTYVWCVFYIPYVLTLWLVHHITYGIF
jgi:hypothetical protein